MSEKQTFADKKRKTVEQAEFTEDGKIIFMVIRYQGYHSKANLTTGITSFQFKYKSSKNTHDILEGIDDKDVIEKIEEFNINSQQFTRELVDMVELVL